MSVRVVVRTFSELCITIGALIVLFVAYVLFWTGVKADSAMDHQIDTLQNQWSKGSVAVEQPRPSPSPSQSQSDKQSPAQDQDQEQPQTPAPYKDGKPFAVMYIPRLGFTWNKPVLQGTGVDILKKGLGHYAGTAQLGQKGNFSVMRPPPHLRRPVQGLPQAASR